VFNEKRSLLSFHFTPRQQAQITHRCGPSLCAGVRKSKKAVHSCGDDSDKSRQSLPHLLDKELFGRLLKQEFNRAGRRRTGVLQNLSLRYTQALTTQISQTAVCNRHQP